MDEKSTEKIRRGRGKQWTTAKSGIATRAGRSTLDSAIRARSVKDVRVNEHIGHVGRSSVSSNERWERAQEHGSVDAMSQSNTGAGYDEFTPVPLTAEALAQLASQDHGLGNVARMMDNGVWNTDGVQDDIRRESIDRDVDRYHRTLDMGERVPRNSRRSEDDEPRISCNSNLSGFDAVGGSFIAHLAPRYGSSSFTSRATSLAMNAIAAELDCTEVRAVSTRGSVAHETAGVQAFHSDVISALFVGHLDNKLDLARKCDVPTGISCAELVFHLYNDCGAAFLDQLQGFFAFCIVDAGSATVFAAVDRHASIPLYKARSKGGGVFIAHPGGSGSSAIKLSTLGEMSKIPAGSYVHGNRHINPHKYARDKFAERALMEMDTLDETASVLSAGPSPFDIMDQNKTGQPAGFSSLFSSGSLFSQSMDDLPSMEGGYPERRETTSPPKVKDKHKRRHSVEDLAKFSDGIGTWNARWNMGEDDDDMDVVQVDGHGSESRMGESFHRARKNGSAVSNVSGLDTAPGTPSKADVGTFGKPPAVPDERRRHVAHVEKKSSPARTRVRKSSWSNGSEEEARGKENMRRVHSDGELNSLSGRSNPKAIPSRAKDDASVISMCRSMSTGHMSSSDALSETECYVSLSLGAGA